MITLNTKIMANIIVRGGGKSTPYTFETHSLTPRTPNNAKFELVAKFSLPCLKSSAIACSRVTAERPSMITMTYKH